MAKPTATTETPVVATTATTHQAEHAEPLWFGAFNAEQTVWISVTLFLIAAIVFGKLPKRIAEGLDAKIAEISKQLTEAKAIRAEAEALLAETRARQAASGNDAAAIIAHARSEAAQLIEAAKADAETLVARRTRMAEDKIAAAERGAAADLRTRVATLATQAARTVIAQQSTDADKSRLTDEAIGALGRH